MKTKNPHPDIDPRGLIVESYQIDGITEPECRSIFLDWAMGTKDGAEMRADVQTLLGTFQEENPEHPMTIVLTEGIEKAAAPKRRGGWRSRRP